MSKDRMHTQTLDHRHWMPQSDYMNTEKTLPELKLPMEDVSGGVKNKEETSHTVPSKKCNRIVKVMLKRLTMDNDKQQILINQAQLHAMPKSKYRKDWDDYYQQDRESDDPVSELLKNRTHDNNGYSSDDTILYNWPNPLSLLKSPEDQRTKCESQ